PARFEQVGNARQTTGDVAGLRGFLRDTRDDVTHIDLGAIGYTDQSVGRQEVLGRHVGTRQQQFLAIGIDHLDRRTDVLAGGRTVLRIHHFDVGQTGQLVGLAVDGDVIFHAVEGHDTLHLGHDRVGVRIPLGHDGPAIDLVAFLHAYVRPVALLVPTALATEVVRFRLLDGARRLHPGAIGVLDVFLVVPADGSAVFHQHVVDRRGRAGRTAHLEGAHGQLGS